MASNSQDRIDLPDQLQALMALFQGRGTALTQSMSRHLEEARSLNALRDHENAANFDRQRFLRSVEKVIREFELDVKDSESIQVSINSFSMVSSPDNLQSMRADLTIKCNDIDGPIPPDQKNELFQLFEGLMVNIHRGIDQVKVAKTALENKKHSMS